MPSRLGQSQMLLASILSAAVAVCGCSGGITAPSRVSPAAAAAQTSGATLTIRVLTRTSELPIEGASVRHDTQSWITGPSGELAISVALGEETAIDVTAAGYEPMGAAAVLGSDERWTFYLAPHQPAE